MPTNNWRFLKIALKNSDFGKTISDEQLAELEKIYQNASPAQIQEAIKTIDKKQYEFKTEMARREKLAEEAATKLNQAIYKKIRK
jgi:hypothetical protein